MRTRNIFDELPEEEDEELRTLFLSPEGTWVMNSLTKKMSSLKTSIDAHLTLASATR